MTRHHSCRVSPFGHPRIHARLTAPRGISQPPTSFIGSQCQGIHHAPLSTYKHKNQIEICITYQQTTPPKTQKAWLARCSQPLSTNQTPHPTTKMERQHASHPTQGPGKNGPVASGPNSVSGGTAPPTTGRHGYFVCRAPTGTPTTGPRRTLPTTLIPQAWGWGKPLRYRCSVERR